MEKRLKQQRNRLFLRVTLILTAVWIAVSAAYCVISLYIEKINVQNRELANISYIKERLSVGVSSYDIVNNIFLSNRGLTYSESGNEKNSENQIILINSETGEKVADTAGKIGVQYGIKEDEEHSLNVYGFISYDTVRNQLSSEQYRRAEKWFSTKRDDGKHYELVCTKFCIRYVEFIPLELKVAAVGDEDAWFVSDEIADTFKLKDITEKDETVYVCNDMRRNIVPWNFLLNGAYNSDLVNLLTNEQRSKITETVSTGFLEYIFYSSDYIYLNNESLYNYLEDYSVNKNNSSDDSVYMLQYAKKFKLYDNIGGTLALGIAVIFVFFLTIAFILCFMIWKMMEVQILQEQKRNDMTNALAHDIKTPLFVISGYAYSLKEHIDESERDSYLEQIIEQTEEINSLVHKMLNLSRLDSYAMTLNRTEFDLYELMNEICGKIKFLPDGKSISLTHGGNNTISADKELIKTAVRNLTDNAVKYSLPESEISIDITDGTLTISNKSEPMTKSEIKQIWQPYVRKDKSRHAKGNGLGLSIVKSVLDLHGIKYDMRFKDSTLTFRAVFLH
ncbi:MAG: HAMP domain-containing histidine kinase [Clostridia bacterium]|nr:HAMP domain-containing histidine kinase [Clostridia bacterium]